MYNCSSYMYDICMHVHNKHLQIDTAMYGGTHTTYHCFTFIAGTRFVWVTGNGTQVVTKGSLLSARLLANLAVRQAGIFVTDTETLVSTTGQLFPARHATRHIHHMTGNIFSHLQIRVNALTIKSLKHWSSSKQIYSGMSSVLQKWLA